MVRDWQYEADLIYEPTRPKVKFAQKQPQPYDTFMSKRLSRPGRQNKNPYIEEVNALIDESPINYNNKSRNKYGNEAASEVVTNRPISPIFQFNTYDHQPTSASLKYNQQAPGQRDNRYYDDKYNKKPLSKNRRQYVHYIKKGEDEDDRAENESAEWVKNYI